jgi:hypothetical protein
LVHGGGSADGVAVGDGEDGPDGGEGGVRGGGGEGRSEDGPDRLGSAIGYAGESTCKGKGGGGTGEIPANDRASEKRTVLLRYLPSNTSLQSLVVHEFPIPVQEALAHRRGERRLELKRSIGELMWLDCLVLSQLMGVRGPS